MMLSDVAAISIESSPPVITVGRTPAVEIAHAIRCGLLDMVRVRAISKMTFIERKQAQIGTEMLE